MWPFRLRSSSCAQRCIALWTFGSRRNKKAFFFATSFVATSGNPC